jgi:hypothetical protein
MPHKIPRVPTAELDKPLTITDFHTLRSRIFLSSIAKIKFLITAHLKETKHKMLQTVSANRNLRTHFSRATVFSKQSYSVCPCGSIAGNMELLSTKVQCGSSCPPPSPALIPAIVLYGDLKAVYCNSHHAAEELQSVRKAVFGCIGDNTLANSVQRFALPFQTVLGVDFSHTKKFFTCRT